MSGETVERVTVRYADGPKAGRCRVFDLRELKDGLRFVDLDDQRIIHRYVVRGRSAHLIESLPLDDYCDLSRPVTA